MWQPWKQARQVFSFREHNWPIPSAAVSWNSSLCSDGSHSFHGVLSAMWQRYKGSVFLEGMGLLWQVTLAQGHHRIYQTFLRTAPHSKSFPLVFCIFNIIRYVDFFFCIFFLFGVLWAFWIYGLVSVINFGKFTAIIITTIYFLLFLVSPSGIPTLHILHLLILPHCSYMFWSGVWFLLMF